MTRLICLLFAFIPTLALAGSLDSLEKAAATAKDTSRIKLLLEISRKYRKQDLDKALSAAQTAYTEAKALKKDIFIARSLYTIGGTYRLKAEYPKAFEHLFQSLTIMKKIGYYTGIADVSNVIGLTHFNTSNYDSAVHYYRVYLEMILKTGDKTRLPVAYNNIANVYYTQKNYPKAIEYYEGAIKAAIELKDEDVLSTLYNNLGAIYDDQDNYPKASYYFNEALKVAEKYNNKKQQASALNNLGVCAKSTGDLDAAMKYHQRSLNLNREVGDKEGEALGLLNIATVYNDKKNYQAAIEYLEQSKTMSEQIGDASLMKDVTKTLAEAYAGAGTYNKAYFNSYNALLLADSIYNEENSRQINEAQAKYDSQKKENEIALLNKDKKIREEADAKRKLLNYFLIAGLLMVFGIAFLLYRNNRLQKKTNDLLNARKVELEKAYDMLHVANLQVNAKNQEITDSINYARRIQLSILPERPEIKQLFKDAFIIYKPKDIVSGDFYWFGEVRNKKILAIADCTGHGVPGALMSMIGVEKLQEAIEENTELDPGSILTSLDKKIIAALKQDDSFESTKDGMDIALTVIDELNNNIYYSGAGRPLLHYSNQRQSLEMIKSDRSGIGGNTGVIKSFTTESVSFNKGDKIYLFTDGYGDQIGGPQAKKLLSKNFKLKIDTIVDKAMKDQEAELDSFFEGWKGIHEQVDDVLVAGVQL